MKRLLITLIVLICLLAGLASVKSQTLKPPTSPRLSTLQKDLAAGNAAALENFWQEISKQGSPLEERVA